MATRKTRKDKPELTGPSLVALLRRGERTTKELAEHFGVTQRSITQAIERLRDEGQLLFPVGKSGWRMDARPDPHNAVEFAFTSDADGWHRFGFSSDEHLGSRYYRDDCHQDLFDKFAAAGIRHVLNTGNWIDGETTFNRHDLDVHGWQNQVEFLVANYPQRDGIKTYAITGEDHEGWITRREGIDIGRYAELAMRDAGRHDWVNLGFMESWVRLVHRETGKSTHMLLTHPGGGSAYAVSYRPQKIVESLSGGSKPAVLLIGHYHKLSYNYFRNVHVVQCGTLCEQSLFMRKHSIEAHVGGGIIEFQQDPATGAIVRFRSEFFNYFDRGYYNNRWARSGRIRFVDRGVRR